MLFFFPFLQQQTRQQVRLQHNNEKTSFKDNVQFVFLLIRNEPFNARRVQDSFKSLLCESQMSF